MKIIIASDNASIKKIIHEAIQKKRWNVIAESTTPQNLIKESGKCKPDIIISTVVLNGKKASGAISIIKSELPSAGIIAIPALYSKEIISEFVKAGATGYVLKKQVKEELIGCIKAVFHKRAFFCSQITASIQQSLVNKISRENKISKQENEIFSDNEKRIINLICMGFTNSEIGQQMSRSKRTVESIRDVMMRRIGINDTASLVVYAIKNKIYKIK